MGVSIFIKTDLNTNSQSISLSKGVSDDVIISPGANIIDSNDITNLEQILVKVLDSKLYYKYSIGDTITININDNNWDLLVVGLAINGITELFRNKPKILLNKGIM